MRLERILVVDDEEDMLEVCREALARTEAGVETESDPSRAIRRLCSESFDVAVLDIRMPGMGGVDLLKAIRASSPKTSVILMTAFPTAETVEESVKLHADGYITKPFTQNQLVSAVMRLLIQKRLQQAPPEGEARAPGRPFDGMVGASPAMRSVCAMIEQVAPTDIDVLIVGESGTGKELIARSVYKRSARAAHRFVPVDCGAIPEHLLESELFGHEKGAFTGAVSTAIGLMEFANQGVLFLDEVCELAPALQAKLLRALQERQIRRVGGKSLIPVDIRVFAATNKNLATEVRAGRFREDLFYRLNALQIEVPPLRSRKEDIAPLFDHFLVGAATESRKEALQVVPEVYEALRVYPWPGNVRELQNVARRAAVVCHDRTIRSSDLPGDLGKTGQEEGAPAGFFLERSVHLREFESRYLSELLRQHAGNVEEAAVEAHLPRGTFYRLMKKHGLSAGGVRDSHGHENVNPVSSL